MIVAWVPLKMFAIKFWRIFLDNQGQTLKVAMETISQTEMWKLPVLCLVSTILGVQ